MDYSESQKSNRLLFNGFSPQQFKWHGKTNSTWPCIFVCSLKTMPSDYPKVNYENFSAPKGRVIQYPWMQSRLPDLLSVFQDIKWREPHCTKQLNSAKRYLDPLCSRIFSAFFIVSDIKPENWIQRLMYSLKQFWGNCILKRFCNLTIC